jgi:hypothetical protein
LEIKVETKLKNYDTHASWIPQQNQLYEDRYVSAQAGQQRLPRPHNQGLSQRDVGQKAKPAEKMPKARALALARTFKRWLVAASIVGFGTFSGLVALHQVGTTTSQATHTSSGSSTTSTTTSTSSSSSQNSNSFLNQGGNNLGTSTSSSTSVSGSSVS